MDIIYISLGNRWQYAVVPLNPVKSTTTDWSSYENYPYYTGTNNGMGVYGYAISGGTFFDTRAAAGGATALDNELERLDTCLGHSAPTIYQYHYHAVSNFQLPDGNKYVFSDLSASFIPEYPSYRLILLRFSGTYLHSRRYMASQ